MCKKNYQSHKNTAGKMKDGDLRSLQILLYFAECSQEHFVVRDPLVTHISQSHITELFFCGLST